MFGRTPQMFNTSISCYVATNVRLSNSVFTAVPATLEISKIIMIIIIGMGRYHLVDSLRVGMDWYLSTIINTPSNTSIVCFFRLFLPHRNNDGIISIPVYRVSKRMLYFSTNKILCFFVAYFMILLSLYRSKEFFIWKTQIILSMATTVMEGEQACPFLLVFIWGQLMSRTNLVMFMYLATLPSANPKNIINCPETEKMVRWTDF